MQCEWLGERVAAPSLKQVVKNTLYKKEAGNWGPNATFKFPAEGGTGGIWKAVARCIPSQQFKFGRRLVSVDGEARKARFDDGSVIEYGKMISCVPLDVMVGLIEGEAPKPLKPISDGLVYSSTHVVGFGIRGLPTVSGFTRFIHFLQSSLFPFGSFSDLTRRSKLGCYERKLLALLP